MYIIKPVPFSLLSVSEPENDAPVWSIGTTYPLGGTVIRNGAVFVSSIAGNLGLDPDNEPQELVGARWLRKSVTNIRKFFDGKLSTKTVGTSPLVIEVTLNANFNSVALLELTSSETLVEMIFGGVTTVLGTIVSGAEPVNNWWKWLNTTFFSSSHRVVLPGPRCGTGRSLQTPQTSSVTPLWSSESELEMSRIQLWLCVTDLIQ